MKISQFLILMSLALGLFGVFADTYKEVGGKKKFTIWAYVVAALIVVSGILTYVSDLLSDRAANEAAIATQREYERRNNELNDILSQQRFISLVSAGSSFRLPNDRPPVLFISMVTEQDSTGEPLESAYNEAVTKFPGFGTMVDSVAIDLAISENRRFSFNKRFANQENSTTAIHSTSTDTLSFYAEQLPYEMLYGFTAPGYKEVLEVLFEFKAGKNLGTMSFYQSKSAADTSGLETLRDIMMHEQTGLYLYVYIEKQGIGVYQTHINIPIKITKSEMNEDGGLTFELTTGDARMDSESFIPY